MPWATSCCKNVHSLSLSLSSSTSGSAWSVPLSHILVPCCSYLPVSLLSLLDVSFLLTNSLIPYIRLLAQSQNPKIFHQNSVRSSPPPLHPRSFLLRSQFLSLYFFSCSRSCHFLLVPKLSSPPALPTSPCMARLPS